MQVVLGTSGFAHPGGSESYVLLMAEQLERLGHDVAIRAVDIGAMAETARERGVRVLGPADDTDGTPDALLVQDAPSAYELAERWPGVPQVFRACSDVHDFQLPPEEPGIVACVVALSDRVAARIRATAARHEVVRLRHPVDVRRFAPLRPIRERPRRAVVLGNYLDGERLEALTASWAGEGIECVRVGGATATLSPELAINDADIVVGKARVAIEAMACGRAAYVYDFAGRDGWVTPERYPAMEADNFAGMATGLGIDGAALAAELAGYDARMGDVNRDLAVRHHHAARHAEALVDLFRRLAPAGARAGATLGELARLGRRQWAAERDAMSVRRELGRAAADRDARERVLIDERDTAVAAYDAAAAERELFRTDRDAWQARAVAAEHDAEAARALLATRRVRAALATGRIADLVRGRS